ncbi:MAG: glycosyltransferase family 2 protein, partial [Actinomycetota bacterium]
RVLAVVVTHNGTAWLGNCLEGLAEQIYPNFDVVVADSASAENVAESFGDMLPEAEFVRVERNVGFGAAANAALEVSSRARDADFFLFLHDDVELEPETLGLMVATALETDAGIVGAKGVEWDRPEVLVEVGMSADQFGYPYSGLDPGEIDQGQHDVQKEVLYVTSACMLVSRSFVERCGLWDAGYFAFGEDLDLCTRARLAGFRVMVQPGARFRHAEALSNERRHVRAIPSNRFLTRRNRLRTITKNVALYRMVPIMALYLGLSVAEVFMLIFFRRFEQIGEYPKALASYLVSLPDVLRRRRAVQRRRAIPDRRLRRLMVSDTDRARVFLERRLRAWEKGTIALGARTLSHLTPAAIKKSLAVWIRRPTTAAGALILIALVVAMRKILIGDQLAVGSLWPFPDSPAGTFLGGYLAAWRDVGLGSESASPPAFAVMWLVSVLGFGSPGFAQRLLIIFLIGAGLAGAYRFVALRAGQRAARMLSMGLYGLGPLTHAAVSGGDLGALGLFAALPYMFEIALRMLGLRQDFRFAAPGKRSRRSARRGIGTQSPAVQAETPEGIEAFPAQMPAASPPEAGGED